jgi:hypothetical protein
MSKKKNGLDDYDNIYKSMFNNEPHDWLDGKIKINFR